MYGLMMYRIMISALRHAGAGVCEFLVPLIHAVVPQIISESADP